MTSHHTVWLLTMSYWSQHSRWSKSGPGLVQVWSRAGPGLVQFWSRYGPVLVQLWSSSGPILVQFWSRSGPVLVQVWSRSGPGLVQVSLNFLELDSEVGRLVNITFCFLWTMQYTFSSSLSLLIKRLIYCIHRLVTRLRLDRSKVTNRSHHHCFMKKQSMWQNLH